MNILLAFFLIFTFVVSSYADTSAKPSNDLLTSLSESPQWQALLRYKKSLIGYKSEVDSKEYFLHLDGKTSPFLELKTTVQELSNNNQKTLCDFPARALWLKKVGVLQNVSLDSCKLFIKMKEKLKLHSVSLIFSGYYINKPASAFGHTFLKLRSKDSVKSANDFLDYGVDFSAIVTTKNPLLYGILGIFGGFDSKFKLMPYYYKIREYNDMENRELWDYELNLSEEDILFFVAHLFEMNKVSFDYYYLTENCSYHILGLLDAVKPEWSLMTDLDTFVPPVQTIHALYKKEGIVRKLRYRAPLNKIFAANYKSLNKKEKKLLHKMIKENSFRPLSEMPDSATKSNLTEAIANYYDYKDSKILLGERDKTYKKAKQRKFDINLIRSKNKTAAVSPVIDDNELANAPHLSHDTKRVQLAYLHQDKLDGAELEYRFSFHDFMDRQIGFIPFSKSELGRLNFRFIDDSFRFDRFTIVEVDALRPLSFLERSISWRFSLGVKDDRIFQEQTFSPFANLSLGGSFRAKQFLAAFFIRTENSLVENFDNHYHLGVGPELLMIFNNNVFTASFEINRLVFPNQRQRYITNMLGQLRYNFTKNTGAYLKFEDTQETEEAYSSGVVFHF